MAEGAAEITGSFGGVTYSAEDPGDSDALFEVYVEQVLSARQSAEANMN